MPAIDKNVPRGNYRCKGCAVKLPYKTPAVLVPHRGYYCATCDPRKTVEVVPFDRPGLPKLVPVPKTCVHPGAPRTVCLGCYDEARNLVALAREGLRERSAEIADLRASLATGDEEKRGLAEALAAEREARRVEAADLNARLARLAERDGATVEELRRQLRAAEETNRTLTERLAFQRRVLDALRHGGER